MYLRAGVLSLGLLILSRLLGLLRESAQAAAFGASGWGDVVILMFTLPDLLVGVLISGALPYVLLPVWAKQSRPRIEASQRQVASALVGAGLAFGLAVWLLSSAISQLLAPGLMGGLRQQAAAAIGWSAAVLPLAALAALWATRLQHERDFVGMYAGSLLVNAALVLGLAFVALDSTLAFTPRSVAVLGGFLLAAMLARLLWLYWRLPAGMTPTNHMALPPLTPGSSSGLPSTPVWVWAALSSGLLLALALVGRSLASQSGEGALAMFNYAWKLIELPLVLAIQLVASLAFPAIAATPANSVERAKAMRMAFVLAWTLACAAVAVVASFALPLAQLLFGWGRMAEQDLHSVAQWAAAGAWSLLPQALTAVALTVTAIAQHMHVAVLAYAAGMALLLAAGWMGLAGGLHVMWALNAVFAGVAAVLLVKQWPSIRFALMNRAMLVPPVVCMALVGASQFLPALNLAAAALAAAAFALLVMGSTVAVSPDLRGVVLRLLPKRQP